ncbi:MAG: radical SAM protein [Patescibacteria group bacterium]
MLEHGSDEAQKTVLTQNGKYVDISNFSSAKRGVNHLSQEEFLGLFKNLRLRVDLTPKCNIWCVFCSNEGSNYAAKKQSPINIDLVTTLGDILLENTPLHSIDLSGGEPTLHPDFYGKHFVLVEWTKKHPETRFSIHSNGINLDPEIIDAIKSNFSRIGLSVHSLNFETWNKITNLGGRFPITQQRIKFDRMMTNIEYIASQDIGDKIFFKSVIIRGINDSEEELKTMLDFCAKNHFHPKLLEFEPQYKEQEKYVVGRKELFEKLENIGCSFAKDAPRHNDPNTYIPGVNFEYRASEGAKMGLHSIFGCGDKAACESCYLFLCMFVKPSENGGGIYLKPCSVTDTRIDLTKAVRDKDIQQTLSLFKFSREYLMHAPGLNSNNWNKEPEYGEDFK